MQEPVSDPKDAQGVTKFRRRDFLKLGILGGLMFPLAALRFTGYGKLKATLKNLSVQEATIFQAVYGVIVGNPNLDELESRRVVRFLDQFVTHLGKKERFELKIAFYLVEHLTFFAFKLGRFSGLDFKSQMDVLKAWEKSPTLLYPVFMGMKELSYLAHYHFEKHYLKIGYEGPVIGGPNEDPEVNDPYLSLIRPL